MVVFSNQRLGASAEIIISDDVAAELLTTTAAQARPFAEARWERELIEWLERRAESKTTLDVSEIAWTPDHFEAQRRFLLEAIDRAAAGSEHALAFDRWRRLIEAHPRDSVQVGRRWQWAPNN
ncbi:MAG: hypothetical protein ABI591_11940 [Kofleriaceae bacterium]